MCFAMAQLLAEFDTESFIVAIKDRPSLWDLSSDEYANRVLKKQLWEEVTLIFGGSEFTTAKEKAELCSNLQKKWRHLKDSFCREKRRMSGIKSGSAAPRKTPYVYYNILSFLDKATPPTNTQSSIDCQDPEDAETLQDNDSPTGPYQTALPQKKRRAEDEIGKQLIDVLKSNAEERRKVEKEVLQDEDKLFMMSLVNDFKKIPQDRKLSAKRQILSVIEQHQHGYSHDFGQLGHTSQYPRIQNTPQPQQTTVNSGAHVEHPLINTSTATPLSTSASSDYDYGDRCSPLVACFNTDL